MAVIASRSGSGSRRTSTPSVRVAGEAERYWVFRPPCQAAEDDGPGRVGQRATRLPHLIGGRVDDREIWTGWVKDPDGRTVFPDMTLAAIDDVSLRLWPETGTHYIDITTPKSRHRIWLDGGREYLDLTSQHCPEPEAGPTWRTYLLAAIGVLIVIATRRRNRHG